MCGIGGFLGSGDRPVLEAMIGRLRHRGPDAEGFFHDPKLSAYLGHARLSILDLASGAQPMGNEDGSIQVVFNGEIYNHHELRLELLALGHRFASHHADTEVLVHGYEAWGLPRLLERLDGMFAFALLDRTRNHLFLARDRMGEKPLFYSHAPGVFAFASEIRPLLAHPGISAELDPLALQKLWAHTFIPAPSTLYRSIRKLKPGHYALYRPQSHELSIEPYWSFGFEPEEFRRDATDAQLAEELEGLLFRSVGNRLEADVAVGIFLSGGIDSTAVLAAANRHRPGLTAFSIGFSEKSFDESVYAKLAARHFNTPLQIQQCHMSEAMDSFPALLDRMDEPLADGSLLATHQLCRFARQSVKVALGGDGSDELFAGYDPFRALLPAWVIRKLLPAKAASMFDAVLKRLPPSERNMSLGFKMSRFLRAFHHDPELWNAVWLGAVTPKDMKDIFRMPVKPEEVYSETISCWRRSRAKSLIDRTQEFYVSLYLPDDILTKVDRASMLASLEVRAPFLDPAIVSFAQKLPTRLRFHRQQGKWLLRRAMQRHLPKEILKRSKKGFGIPLAAWLKQMPTPAPSTRLTDLVDERHLTALWREHAAASSDHRHTLLCWLTAVRHLGGAQSRELE